MKEMELIPTTQRNKDGELYQRSPEIESQIREALTLDRKRLFERANQKDYGTDDYFQPECLVYLIRAFRISGELELADKLMVALIDRCKKKIDTILRKLLTQHYINECFEEAIDEIIGQIYDISSGRSNFAEIKFWLWLEGRVCNVRRKYFKFQEDDSKTDNFDDHFRGSQVSLGQELERKDRLAKAMKSLTERERQVYMMRHVWEWKIHSKDPSENTISKHFKVSDKAVQNWLRNAEEKLRNGNKG